MDGAAANPRPFINEASASDPMPMEQRLKKWRRVRSRRLVSEGMGSVAGDGFVEIKQDAGGVERREILQKCKLVGFR